VIVGVLLLAAGTGLQLWTILLLKPRGITGQPELGIAPSVGLVECGAFSIVRHPTYLAHTLMLGGIFLLTGYATMGCIALLDLAVVQALIVPLEERELEQRFGDAYVHYCRRVPRLIPFTRSGG
jgi:protein-S-isoprenylcysteine O-methyltransferase Ste14